MTDRIGLRSVWLAGCLAAWLAAGALPARGEAPATEEAERIQFRRIYAPQRNIDQWPQGTVRYLPVPAEEFEQRVRQRAADEPRGPAPGVARADEMRWHGRLDGETLSGRTEWNIHYRAESPVVLGLGQADFALGELSWHEESEAALAWGMNPAGEIFLRADRAGIIQGDWSLRGTTEASRQIRFQFELPRAMNQALRLELPPEFQPRVAGALVTEITDPELPDAERDDFRSWEILLGARRSVSLQLVPSSSADASPEVGRLAVRQAATYDFSTHGLQLNVQLDLTAKERLPADFTCRIDPGLQPIRVRARQQDLPWSLGMPDEAGRSELRIALDSLEPQSSATLQLRLLAPLALDRPAPLPNVIVDESAWHQGSALLLVPHPLLVQELEPADSLLSSREPLAGMVHGESFHLQCFGPDPRVAVRIGLAGPRPSAQLVESYRFSPRNTTARVMADLTPAAGDLYQLEIEVAPDWVVEAVESDPVGWIGDWVQSDPTEGDNRLSIQFEPGLGRQENRRLIVSGRRHRPAGREPLPYRELAFLRFPDVELRASWLYLHAEPQLELQVKGTEDLPPAETDPLPQALVSLLEEQPGGVLLRGRRQEEYPVGVLVQRREPEFRAALRGIATVGDERLSERWEILCRPIASDVDHLIVHLSAVQNGRMRWYEQREGGVSELTGRKLSLQEQSGLGLPLEGETWRIELDRPRQEDFLVVGRIDAPFRSPHSPALALVVSATEQQGTLEVHTESRHTPAIENHRLRPVPIGRPSPLEISPVLARFQYDPQADLAIASSPAITISPGSELIPEAFVWQALLDSRYSAAGAGRHRLTLRIQNDGRPRLGLTLPADVEAIAVWLEGEPLEQVDGNEGRTLQIELPAQRRFSRVVVEYRTSGSGFGWRTALACPLPEIDLPVLTARWQIWTPLGYELRGSTWGTEHSENRSWRERLFGPLGRQTHRSFFDPLSLDSWRAAFVSEADGSLAGQRALDWLIRLERELNDSPDRPLGTLLVEIEGNPNTSSEDRPPLWIDQQALLLESIRSDTLLAVPDIRETPQRALRTLERNGLALLVLPEQLLLTTPARLAQWREELVELSEGKVAWVRGDSNLIAEVSEAYGSLGLVTPQTWEAAEAASADPWTVDPLVRETELTRRSLAYVSTGGWNVAQLNVDPRDPPHAVVLHTTGFQALAWCLWLSVTVAAFWLMPRGWAAWFASAVLSGSLALYLPADGSRLATALFLGLVAALAGRWLLRGPWRFARAAEPKTSLMEGSTQRIPIPTAWLAAACLLLPATTHAEEPPRESPHAAGRPSEQTIHQVFIPIDEDERPAGEMYFVPEPLFRELFGRASSADPAVPDRRAAWFRDARYEGRLEWDAARRQLVVDDFRLSLLVQTWESQTVLALPLRREQLELLPAGTTLDGVPVSPQWDEQSQRLSIRTPQPGLYRLSMQMLPLIQREDDRHRLLLSILPLADSTLKLTYPADAPPLSLHDPRGGKIADGIGGELEARLAGSDTLDLRWQPRTSRGPEAPPVEGSQLLLLQVRPGSIVLESRVRFQPGERSLQRARLRVDPRLRILSDDEPSGWSLDSSDEEPGLLEFTADPASNGEATLITRFLVSDAPAGGRLPLPEVQPAGVRLLHRWLVVDLDESLSMDAQFSANLRPSTAPALLRAWPLDDDEVPGLAYQLPTAADAEPPLLALRPRSGQTEGDAELKVVYGSEELDLEYTADLTTRQGYLLHLRMQVPPDYRPDRVSLLQDDTEQVERWSLTPEGRLTLFLKNPVVGDHSLRIGGRLGTKEAGDRLPSIRLLSGQAPLRGVEIYRRPEVMLDVEPSGYFEHDPGERGADLSGAYNRVARLIPVEPRSPAEAPPSIATVTGLPNHPVVHADQLVSLQRGPNRWRCRIDLQLNISQGVLDRLRMRISRDWTEDIRVDPEMDYRLIDAAEENYQWLVLIPSRPISGTLNISVTTSPLQAARRGIEAPTVELPDADRSTRYLLLPRHVELQRVSWDVQGLRPDTIPFEPEGPPLAPESFYAYRIVGERYQAVLRQIRPTSGAAQVWLMDVEVAPHAAGGWAGTVRFDLTPAGLRNCRVRLPEGERLLHLAVDRVPAALVEVGDREVQFGLASEHLPQRIDATFTISGDRHSAEAVLEVPSLWMPAATAAEEAPPASSGETPGHDRPIDVARTLWTVYGAARLQRTGGEELAGESPSALVLQRERLNGFFDLMQSQPIASASSDTASWFSLWDARIAGGVARARALAELEPPAGLSREQTRQAIVSLLQQRQQWVDRLETPVADATDDARRAARASLLEPLGLPSDGRVARAVFLSDVTHLVAITEPSRPTAASGRILLAGVLLGFSTLLMWYRDRIDLADALLHWPHAFGVGIGLVFWLWMWPSVLGLLLISVSLLLAWLPRWSPATEANSTLSQVSSATR